MALLNLFNQRGRIWLLLAFSTLFLTGCQMGYLVRSAVDQVDLLKRRVPIEQALKDPDLSDEQKRKLQLAVAARKFSEEKLGLKTTKNYTSYVQLQAPYVTWVVSAAPKDKLEHHLWKYPLVGSLPYRGYFNEKAALDEMERMKAKGFDVFVRGVTAYSTLGWFRDPILSSMLDYKDHDLANVIMHETVHATIYIKSEADFNERLATFIGNKGTEMFYAQLEGAESPTLRQIADENQDNEIFSKFISAEINSLKDWYKKREGQAIPEEERQARLGEILERFRRETKPLLKTNAYSRFETTELNNARLLTYQLYYHDLSDFDAKYRAMNSDFPSFLDFCKSLEGQKDPVKFMKDSLVDARP